MSQRAIFSIHAGVAELADALDLGSSAARRGSSNLFARTNHSKKVKREWLSGRASPCQGECRGFESRLPLQVWRHSQVVRQRSAKPLFPSSNLGGASILFRRSGGTGRRTGLKILRFLRKPYRFDSGLRHQYQGFERFCLNLFLCSFWL